MITPNGGLESCDAEGRSRLEDCLKFASLQLATSLVCKEIKS